MVFAHSILSNTELMQSICETYEKWQSTLCDMERGSNEAININFKYWQFILILIRCRPLKYTHGMSASYTYNCIYPISFRVSQYSLHKKTYTLRIFASHIHSQTSFPNANRYRNVTAYHCLLAGLCIDNPFLRHFNAGIVLKLTPLNWSLDLQIINSF